MNVQKLQFSKEINEFEKASDWFYKHMDDLRKDGLTNKYVAIKGEQIIASGEKVEIVVTKIEKGKQNPSFVFIGFIYPKGYTILL